MDMLTNGARKESTKVAKTVMRPKNAKEREKKDMDARKRSKDGSEKPQINHSNKRMTSSDQHRKFRKVAKIYRTANVVHSRYSKERERD